METGARLNHGTRIDGAREHDAQFLTPKGRSKTRVVLPQAPVCRSSLPPPLDPATTGSTVYEVMSACFVFLLALWSPESRWRSAADRAQAQGLGHTRLSNTRT